MIRIVVDTDCDAGSNIVCEGAKKALDRDSDLELVLFAGKDNLPEDFSTDNFLYANRLSLESTDHTYDPNKKNIQPSSSIYGAIDYYKKGNADAVIASGETKGAYVSSFRILRRVDGISKPAIITSWLGRGALIDSGANPDCTPEDLLYFAIMGRVFSKYFLGLENSRMGLLTIGREMHKGNELIKNSQPLVDKLKDIGYNISEEYFEGDFIKYIIPEVEEDIMGETDYDGIVVVTDGHTGNIVLKNTEEVIKAMLSMYRREIEKEIWPLEKLTGILNYRPLRRLVERLYSDEHVAAPLLGVNGNVMIAHGISDDETIAKAIKATKNYVIKERKIDLKFRLKEEIEKCKEEGIIL